MSGKVSAFPLYKLHDIPDALRQVANKLEHGELSATRCVLVMETAEGTIDYACFGEEPYTRAHAVGLCIAAAQTVLGS